MGPEETEKSIEEIVGMIKQGDLSLAPKLYEQTKGIICYVVWREWRREHIRRGAKARGMEVEDLLQEGYFMMIQSAQLYDSSIGASFKGIPVRPYPGPAQSHDRFPESGQHPQPIRTLRRWR